MMSTQCRAEMFVSFARRLVIRRRTAGSMMNGRRKTQTGRPEVHTGGLFPVIIVERTGIFCENAKEKGGITEDETMELPKVNNRRRWLNSWGI